MSTGTIPTLAPVTDPPPEDPFFYGWRYASWTDEHGETRCKMVPLTEWDVLHPQEDDHFVITPAHSNDCNYLEAVFKDILASRPGVLVLREARIDFQEGEDSVYGPDVTVFDHLNVPFDLERGTFPVKEMEAIPVVAVEVVSPSTARTDRVTKVTDYYRMGVPLYVIVDRETVNGGAVVSVYGYRAVRKGYERVPADPKGVWIPSLRVWLRGAGSRVACFDEQGNRIPDLTEQRDNAERLAEQERRRAEEERRRAEEERQRAEEERQLREAAEQQKAAADQRAAEMAQKIADMEAELRRLRGEANRAE